MATLVAFHAHPDDEVLTTGGTLAKAASAGHRVVLVVATGGELGEVPADLGPNESLAQRRVREVERSAAILGAHAVRFLGYLDSGMADTPDNARPGAFAAADCDEAAARLAAILDAEGADVLTVYDERGNYGHPDHIQVHRVGHAAAARTARPPVVYEATLNRDQLVAWFNDIAADEHPELEGQEQPEALGMPESVITTRIDVTDFVDRKREAFRAHASQTTDSGFFLRLSDRAFHTAFSHEWFIRPGPARGADEPFGTDLFA